MDKKIIFIFLAYLVIGSICISFLWNKDMIADEIAHAKQIRKFIFMDTTIIPQLTVFPFYHYVISSIAKLFFVQNLIGYRVITFLILMGLIYVFYKLSGNSIEKTTLFYFFPILFLYFFLVYTDLFSLMLILYMFYFMLKRNYIVSGIFGLLSVFTRQNNFIWVIFICVYLICENYYENLRIGINNISYKKKIINHLKIIYPYLISLFIFSISILINKTVVIGDVAHHRIGIYFNNIWFILFCFVFLFMPYCINNFSNVILLFKKSKLYFLVMVIPLLGIVFFKNTHEYNKIDGIWFNIILELVNNNFFIKILFFMVILYGIYILIITKFEDKKDYLFYIFTILFLAMSEMVEVRYYFIPFTLFLLFKEKDIGYIKWFTLIYYILLSCLLFFTLIKT